MGVGRERHYEDDAAVACYVWCWFAESGTPRERRLARAIVARERRAASLPEAKRSFPRLPPRDAHGARAGSRTRTPFGTGT